MAVIVGIDEAGYGPLLGPLVLSSTTFHGPDDISTLDLWQALSASVARQRRRLAGRLLITDSKKAFTRSTGLGHLERTVLAVLQAQGIVPQSLEELLLALCPVSVQRLCAYPWYQDLGKVRLSVDNPDKAVAAAAWQRDLERQGIRIGPIRVACLDVGYYNHLVDAVRNKSSVLFSTACTLIQQALESCAGDEVTIIVDHQGGRVHYRGHLQRMFPQMALTILQEEEKCSRYRMLSESHKVELIFLAKADQAHLPVSLASMVAKYIRELLMACINHHFQGFCPDLTPTAGYWQDGQRFLKDLATKCSQVPIERDRLVRNR